MAEIKTVARPYAKAAFMTALENNNFTHWTAFFECMSIIMNEQASASLLTSPNLDPTQQIDLMTQLVIAISKKNTSLHTNKLFITDPKAINFVKILIENKKLTLIPEIYTQFEALRLHEQHIVRAQVFSPYAVTIQQEKAITSALEKRFEQTVEIEVQLDHSLIGGIIIKAGDLVIDGSIKGQIEKLHQALA